MRERERESEPRESREIGDHRSSEKELESSLYSISLFSLDRPPSPLSSRSLLLSFA
ncbi:hypothetical protein DPMN_172918 [Dreissena polymorpha]|uniref:Uncharacterized protein n=1 Tax=Dreissena polymorpha TaxID=45954 RepID=A0A9D4IGH3_DREPO|nr:hypothetical protein DPMN_172918 [Dreissena polymorpha]